jgi:integrase
MSEPRERPAVVGPAERYVNRRELALLMGVSERTLTRWLREGLPSETFFNDAATVPAGRLVDRNPFAKLGLRGSRGRRDTMPPGQVEIARFLQLADELTPPFFAAYLDVAVHEGMRPGELDALRWDRIDFQAGTILVDQQWNAKVRKFTPPKHGVTRTIALTRPARERLLRLRRSRSSRSQRSAARTTRPRPARRTGTAFAAAPGSATSISTWLAATTSAGMRSTFLSCRRK